MLFEDIMMAHDEKEIMRLCKKLNRSCSFTKNSDMATLCELAYWLYVFNDKENVLKVCEYTNIDIPITINYNIWDFILFIWGLEAHIYDEYGRMDDKNFRILQIKKVRSTPKNKDETEESAWKFSQKIMNRVSFESACMIKNIEQDSVKDDIKKGNKYRLLALYNMIGYGVTGFYPDLEKNKDKLNSKINEYIMCLREN